MAARSWIGENESGQTLFVSSRNYQLSFWWPTVMYIAHICYSSPNAMLHCLLACLRQAQIRAGVTMPVVNVNQVDQVEYVDDEEQHAEVDERTGQFLIKCFVLWNFIVLIRCNIFNTVGATTIRVALFQTRLPWGDVLMQDDVSAFRDVVVVQKLHDVDLT